MTTETLKAGSESQLREAIAWAAAASQSLEIVAGPGRSSVGRPVEAAHRLDVAALAGIVSYQPEELVLTALAGTPLDEIEASLAQHRQMLAFEPPRIGAASSATGAMDPGGSSDSAAGSATLGGTVATGLSGPRRLRMGAVRDHVLGIGAVSGRGESFYSGGKVIKNVTGYDLPKLLTGSHGTLAALHEITLKVLPAPEAQRTLLILGLDPVAAVRVLTEVLQTQAEASGACHLPAPLHASGKPAGTPVTALRLEGFRASVDDRLGVLRKRLQPAGAQEVLDDDASADFWRAIRDVQPLAAGPHAALWRLSVPPADGAAVFGNLAAALPDSRAYMDWGGGLLWLSLPLASVSQAAAVRGALGKSGGHATLIQAPESIRAASEVFQPQPAPLAGLSRRVKLQFDPLRVLNPGRMYAGV